MSKPSEMDLRDYGRILMRRKWWVLGAMVMSLGLAFVLNAVTAPVYRATVRIQISREPTRSPLTGAEMESPSAQSDNLALYTAAELITNRRLMSRVAAALRDRGVLTGEEGDAQPWLDRVLRGRAAAATTVAAQGVERGVSNSEVDWLLSHINVEPVRDTRLVNIHVELQSPRTAEQVANAVADMFVQHQTDQQAAGSSTLVTYLTNQIQQVRTSLQQTEQASFYLKARNERAAIAVRLAQLRSAADSSNPDFDGLQVHTGNLDALRKQLSDSETELAKARQIYMGRHPRLVLLESENTAIRNSIRNELSGAIAQTQAELNAAVARERSTSNPGGLASRDPATIESDLANNRDLYNALVTKLKEAEMTGQTHGPLVEVVEPAAAEPDPVRPRKMMNFIVCLFVGVVIGTGLAFLREYLRRTIRTPQNVDDHLQLPVLGLIPKA